ncbi:glycosyltransferase family 4 protein [Methanothermococcus okinawensis]|uniref:Glycosyl transferase group 1 n=1 Tax=Methanothermococcus okinawensis (strain DSM 14208 / JCM 11175 / IH1) TaxID=647113 RepID=F8ALJ7_METOI|nr:glycosyltransferase family 4 protein [Methanothermococcus okinawensis]AEH07155.1 glycosyl transferase group 1 [Methanothermococcus okinawensis IH1]
MKIAMITWEYPPIMVGGLSVHCKGLAEALVRAGHDVDVITVGYELPEYENINGVNVHRVKPIGHPNFLTWATFMAHFMEKKLGSLGVDNYDIIHCHDWMTHFVGSSVKHLLNKPYIQSIHSTEQGRCGGIYSDDSRAINDIEWWSTYESHAVITVSNSIKEEICSTFNTPWDKVNVIYNGINPWEFDIPMDDNEKNEFRAHIGIQPYEKMILFVGRLVYQKGVEYLIRATPKILEQHPNSKIVIAGSGDMRGYLEDLAFQLGCRDKILFLGFVGGDMLKKLFKSADVAVIPSVYEPFGIVALEAMAAGAPVVASSVGGLKEIIQHEHNGVLVYPKNPDSIAWGVNKVLSDEGFKEWIVNNAKHDVYTKYSWDVVANRTVDVYNKVINSI